MFTIKFYHYSDQSDAQETPAKLVQAEQVDIEVYDEGDFLKHVILTSGRGDTFHQESFMIGRPSKPENWDPSVKFFDKAYIENETGATTQVVRRTPGSNRKP